MTIIKQIKLFGFLILMAFINHSINAQDNAIKINILSPIFKTLNVSYEHKVSETAGLQIGFFYTGASTDDTSFKGIGITPEYRFYLSDTEAIEGVYIAPFVRYQNFTLTNDNTNDEGTLSTFGGGLVLGRQWVFKEKITLDTFIGPQYLSGSVDVKSGTNSFDVSVFDGFGLRAGLTFGFAF